MVPNQIGNNWSYRAAALNHIPWYYDLINSCSHSPLPKLQYLGIIPNTLKIYGNNFELYVNIPLKETTLTRHYCSQMK